ncbi:hypothetical protein [Bizionia paragorgiae]|uniref:hypothetical protein n=1 Tax=Bizionia paragorgiae TaxID=283786 RepID=UPI00299F0407|nr:hypothetical protein [Bizionia paragorgiae]MDX1271704.1 hypothetical protein [Bizionia paragorgiae]
MRKKTFYSGILILALTLITSCSSDDDSNSSMSENAQKLLGTWGNEWDNAVHPKFTFESNSNVKYYTYPSGNNPELEEIGTWSMNGDILIMEFPDNVLIKFKNRIVFVSESELEFEEIQESGFDSWSAATYFKTDNPNL